MGRKRNDMRIRPKRMFTHVRKELDGKRKGQIMELEIIARIVAWLLIVLIPVLLLGCIPLVGWVLGLAWMLIGSYAIVKGGE